jgi:ribose transport system permease protein
MEKPMLPDEPRTLEAPAAGSQTPAAGSAESGRPVAGRIRNLLSQSGPLLGLLVLGFVLTLMSDRFLTFTNLTNVGQQIAVIAIVALGSTFVIISGGIDLSVGSVLALSSAVFAIAFAQAHLPLPLAILGGLLAGVVAGIVNGLLITFGRLPPFIATLAMLSVARGLVLVVTDGRPISGFPPEFRVITEGTLLFDVPLSLGLMLALFVLGAIALRNTVFGRATYAVGGNEEVARLSGVRVVRTKLGVYALSGLFAAVGGLVLTSRLNSAQPVAGQGLELDVIAAVVIGGASLSGGEGGAFRTLLGALVIGVLRNGLNLVNVSSFWQQVAVGAVIAAAVMTDTLRRRKG